MRVSMLFLFAVAACAQSWVSLFDGKTLDGWEIRSGHATYRVDNGEIVGRTVEGSPNTFLCTRKTYSNFILEFEVNTDPKLNSGVQIRSHVYEKPVEVVTENKEKRPVRHQPGRVYGYQVEIANEQSGASGGIYDEARRGWLANTSSDAACRAAFKDNQWNRYRIEARGDNIKTWVNGVACANLTDSMDREGFIGLQVHGYKGEQPAEVRWRNLRIQELK